LTAIDTTYVGLLRGVNVGRSVRIAMADLRALVEQLGYREATTLLNSGNVTFKGPRAETSHVVERIESALLKAVGAPVSVVVLTGDELAAAAAANPLTKVASDPSRLVLVATARPEILDRLTPLAKRDWAPEALAVGPRAAYFWCPGGFADSPVAEAVRRAVGDEVTMRNWATIDKLLAITSRA
jgi:uncharacterized protein (DUF1697 family)